MRFIVDKKIPFGFTALELLIVFAIIGILLIATIPNYRSVVARNRASAIKADLMTAIRLARTEAIRRQTRIRICGLNAAQTSCSDTNPWQNGFRVQVEGGFMPEMIQDFPYTSSGITICGSMMPVIFTPGGVLVSQPNCNSNGIPWGFNVQPLGTTEDYLINIETTGRPTTTKFQ